MPQAPAQLRRIFRSSPHQHNQPETKQGLLANPGSLLVGAFGILFVGYVFNVRGLGTRLDGFFSGLNQAAHGHEKQVTSLFVGTLPLIAGAFLVLVALAVLRALGPSTRSLAKTQEREIRGIEAFVDEAGQEGVSKKVARAAYRLLLPQVRKAKHLGVRDTLSLDLKVRPDQVSNLYGTLLRHTDRRRRQGDDGAKLRTVLAMMLAVEASEDKSVPTATLLAFKAAAPIAAPSVAGDDMDPVLAAELAAGLAIQLAAVRDAKAAKAGPIAVVKAGAVKSGAVLLHPARLARRELSMMRSRAVRGIQAR